jgi:hypothetical protein
MIMVLLDEPTIILFDSPDNPPDCLEAVDVMNGEYSFCDDDGQRYVGVVTRSVGGSYPVEYRLRPDGEPDLALAKNLAETAVMLVPNPWYADLESLRRHLKARNTVGTRTG